MFVLIRNEDGKYVAKPGRKNSYTTSLEHARKFQTEEEAERDRCGNERIVSLAQEINKLNQSYYR